MLTIQERYVHSFQTANLTFANNSRTLFSLTGPLKYFAIYFVKCKLILITSSYRIYDVAS